MNSAYSTFGAGRRRSRGRRSRHDRDGVGHRVRLRRDRRRPLAESLNVDAVGHVEHVRHVVADQDDGHTPVAQVAGSAREPGSTRALPGRRWARREPRPSTRSRGPGDGDGLPLPAGEVLDGNGHVLKRRDAERRSSSCAFDACRRCRACGTPSPASPPCASPDRGRGWSHVERGRDREVLVHGLDAGSARILRAFERDLLAVEQDLTLVRDLGTGEALDQRRLAGAVVADDRRAPRPGRARDSHRRDRRRGRRS